MNILLAAVITLTWVAPTENIDGTELTDLDGYVIYWGASSRDYSGSHTINDETLTEHTMCLAAGTYYFAMTAFDADGNESAYSNEVLKTEDGICVTAPLPPVILQQEETVFHVIKQPDRFVLLPIGTVPAGTVCDPNQSVNGHGVVPADAVIWSPGSTARPVVVVAECNG